MDEKKQSYYQKHKEQRSAYAKEYYRRKKESVEKKPRRKYKTWRSNQDIIEEHKKYIQDNGITSITIRFTP